MMKLLLPLSCAGMLLYAVPLLAQTPPKGPHEWPDQCKAQQGKPGGDCYCGAFPNLEDRTVLSDGTIQLRYKTDPIISGNGDNFGCWYLTGFRTDSGYKLLKYEFTTITGFGRCTFAGAGTGDQMNSQNWQECGVVVDPSKDPKMRADLLFKFRIKGHTGKQVIFSEDNLGKDRKGPAVNITPTITRDYNQGGAIIALWYAPNK